MAFFLFPFVFIIKSETWLAFLPVTRSSCIPCKHFGLGRLFPWTHARLGVTSGPQTEPRRRRPRWGGRPACLRARPNLGRRQVSNWPGDLVSWGARGTLCPWLAGTRAHCDTSVSHHPRHLPSIWPRASCPLFNRNCLARFSNEKWCQAVIFFPTKPQPSGSSHLSEAERALAHRLATAGQACLLPGESFVHLCYLCCPTIFVEILFAERVRTRRRRCCSIARLWRFSLCSPEASALKGKLTHEL